MALTALGVVVVFFIAGFALGVLTLWAALGVVARVLEHERAELARTERIMRALEEAEA